MLRLRADQMLTLSAASLAPRLHALLRDSFPAALPDRSFALGVVSRAIAAGMETEQQVGRYAALALVVRPDFETHPDTAWARPALADRAMPAERKLSRLYALARRNGFSVAAARSGP